LLEVLRQDYIRTARAKGLPENVIMARHAMRNVALPFVTIIGGLIPTLLTSSVIIERLFNLPGMGRYLVDASINLDYPVIMTTTMVFALITLLSTLIVDLSYAWLDPRVSYSSGTRRAAR
jgi:ABC-type dipeptide/oligopeptide/nickel transport system permease component